MATSSAPSNPLGRLVLVRHGETEWSRDRRHTGRSDIGLTSGGERQATALRRSLAGWRFGLVLTSPLQRAAETARLAGLADLTADLGTCEDLVEWDYGTYEGMTTAEIRRQRPHWEVFRDGCPGGEDAAAVAARADAVLGMVQPWVEGAHGEAHDVALVAHAHLLRVLAVRWLGLDPRQARHLSLDSGSWSVLAHERETPVVQRWNQLPSG